MRNISEMESAKKRFSQYIHNPVLVVLCVVVVLVTIFSTLQTYNGWDTAYYVSYIESAVKENSIYKINPLEGQVATAFSFQSALCGFYAHFIVMCKLLHVEGRIMAMYGMRGLCVILSCMIIYCYGKVLFGNDRKRAVGLTILWIIFQFFATAGHTTAYFMFVRGYEAKGFCANVVLPMVLLCILALLRHCEEKKYWIILGITVWASVPMSMSAMVIAPAAVAVYGIVEVIQTKTIKTIISRCIVCVFPNLLYLTVFLLIAQGVIPIQGGI